MKSEQDKNEFKMRCLTYFNTLVQNCDFGHRTNWASGAGNRAIKGFQWNNSPDRDQLKEMLDFAVETMFEMDEKIDARFKDEVETEDLVVLSIDGGSPTRYFITRYGAVYSTKPTVGGVECVFNILDATNGLGRMLLGKHVGETIEFLLDDDKNEHKAVILSCRKTEKSVKLNNDELEADLSQTKGK